MQMQILKTIVTVGLLCSSNLLADAVVPTPQEYQEIVDSFKLIDTSKRELSQIYKINGEKVKAELQKKEDEQFQWVQHIITKYKPYETTLGEPNEWVVVNKYDQKLLSVACIAPDKKTVLASIARSSDYYKRKKQKFVIYSGYVAGVDKDSCCGNYWIDGGLLKGENPTAQTQIPTYNPKEFYPYFNEQRILNRLYETNTCDKELTEKANIEVLVGDKWIPQEQSWNIKDEISNNINSSSKNPSITLNQLLENSKTNQKVSIEDINDVLKNEELNQKIVQKYNDIAYYLQQVNANDEAIFLLEKIIEKFPNRTVAYLNLADAYNGINNKDKAKENYEKYINLMEQDNKENKIPKRVLEYK